MSEQLDNDVLRAIASPEQDHFARLGLARQRDVSRAVVDAAYRARSASVHPDHYANADERTRALAEAALSMLNEARRVVAAPGQRLDYLLELAGVDWQHPPVPAQDFLLDMLERREALEAVGSDPNRLAAWGRALRDELSATSASAEAAWDDGRLDDAVVARVRVRYLQRLADEVTAREDGEAP